MSAIGEIADLLGDRHQAKIVLAALWAMDATKAAPSAKRSSDHASSTTSSRGRRSRRTRAHTQPAVKVDRQRPVG